MKICTIIAAAGRGQRLGEDKALMILGPCTAIERVVRAHRAAGVDEVRIVRRDGAAALPALDARVVVADPPEMIDSVRAALGGNPPTEVAWFVFHPVDYPLATEGVLAPLVARCRTTKSEIVLPLFDGRPGHPIAFAARLAREVLAPATISMRDVIRADRSRVDTIEVDTAWIHRDIDRPEDLAAAREFLADR